MTLMQMLNTIYVKTDKGRESFEGRLHGLPAKARRVLILVDGHKAGAELSAAAGVGKDIKSLLKLLLKEGFIAPRDGQILNIEEEIDPDVVESALPSPSAPESADDSLPEFMLRARYVKTDKGREELEGRSHGLRTKARRVLILVDAQKTGFELSEITGFGEKTKSLLKMLLDEGFIAPCAEKIMELVKPPVAVESALPLPPSPPPKPKRADYPPEVIALAKQLMLDTTQSYLGLLGADIKRRLEASNDSDSIISCVAQWSLALHQSKKGKPVAADHVQEVQTILGLVAEI